MIKIVNKSWTLSAITAGFVIALLAMMAVIIVVILPRVRKVQKLTDNINLVTDSQNAIFALAINAIFRRPAMNMDSDLKRLTHGTEEKARRPTMPDEYISRAEAVKAANEWVSEACMAPVMRVSRLLDKLQKCPPPTLRRRCMGSGAKTNFYPMT